MVPTAVLFSLAVIYAVGASKLLISLIPFAVILAAITVIDLRELRIPNKIILPAMVLCWPFLAIASTADYPADLSLGRAAAAAVVFCLAYFVLAIISPAGLGLGDVKLAFVLGAQLGLFHWAMVLRAAFIAHLLMAVVAVLLMASRKAKMKSGLPFGPFLAIGSIAAIVFEAL